MLVRQLDDFVKHLRFEKRGSPHTVVAYETDLKQFAEYLLATYDGLNDAADIRHYHIRSWLAEAQAGKALSAASRNRKLAALNSFFKSLMLQGKLSGNPCRVLHSLKKPERLPGYLKAGETEKLLEEVSFGEDFRGATDRLICELLYSLGLRRAELIGLQERDVEKSNRTLRVLGKGNKERLLPLGPELLSALDLYKQQKRALNIPHTGYLLQQESGRPLNASYVYRTVRHYLSLVSTLKKQSPHVLRHTFATQLLQNGASIQAIKDLLGHSSLAATQIYAHNDITQLKEIHARAHPRG